MPVSKRLVVKKILRATAALTALVVLSSQVWAGYPVKVRDARGKYIKVSAKPMRIVSLAPNITEILFALGAGDRVVGVTKYCNYPAEARNKPKVGDMSASAEAVIAKRPDLVVGHAVMNDTLISQLEGLHRTVFAMDPKTISQLESDIKSIGQAVDCTNAATKIVTKMQSQMAAVKKARTGKKPLSVMVVIQANPLWVAGPSTFVDEMLKIANSKNVAYNARPGFVTFSKELAVSRSPEVIIVGSESDRSYFLTAPVWKNTRASRAKRVYVVNNDLLVRPGPRLTDGLKAIAGCLGKG